VAPAPSGLVHERLDPGPAVRALELSAQPRHLGREDRHVLELPEFSIEELEAFRPRPGLGQPFDQVGGTGAERLVQRDHGVVELAHIAEESQGAGGCELDLHTELVTADTGQARSQLVSDDKGAQSAGWAGGDPGSLVVVDGEGISESENQRDPLASHLTSNEAALGPLFVSDVPMDRVCAGSTSATLRRLVYAVLGLMVREDEAVRHDASFAPFRNERRDRVLDWRHA
jgi:hypothetical protein